MVIVFLPLGDVLIDYALIHVRNFLIHCKLNLAILNFLSTKKADHLEVLLEARLLKKRDRLARQLKRDKHEEMPQVHYFDFLLGD